MSIKLSPAKVRFTIAGMGAFIVVLDPIKAPETVKNFMNYIREDFYKGTIFHRVIPGFMIQGGGFTKGAGRMDQKKALEPVKSEASNGLKNKKFTIAMARTSDPHSATSQFFINVADNGFLNHTGQSAQGQGYTVFGHVIEGQDVIERMAKVVTGRVGFHDDVPKEDVTIESVEVTFDEDLATATWETPQELKDALASLGLSGPDISQHEIDELTGANEK